MKFVKEFILNYGRKIIDISFLLSFVVATIAFFVLAVGYDIISAIFIFICAIVAIIALFYTIYVFIDIRDKLEHIGNKLKEIHEKFAK